MTMLVIQNTPLEREIVVRILTLHFPGKMTLTHLIITDGKKVMIIHGEEISLYLLMIIFFLRMVILFCA